MALVELSVVEPHQAIGMAAPAERFSTAAARAEEDLLPLRLPALIALAPVPPSPADPPQAAPVDVHGLRGTTQRVRMTSMGCFHDSRVMVELLRPSACGHGY